MLQTIPQSSGIYPGFIPGDRCGNVWDLPPLRCPGAGGQLVEVYADDREAPAAYEIPPQTARRLALAVIARALREAQTRDQARLHDRDQARHWLRAGGDDLAYWLELAGSRITLVDLAGWVDSLNNGEVWKI